MTYNDMIGSYIYFPTNQLLPEGVVPLLGGNLRPIEFVDALRVLKSRVPTSWIQWDAVGSVTLPLVQDRVLQFDSGLPWGAFQDDAIRNIEGGIGNVLFDGGYATGPFSRRFLYEDSDWRDHNIPIEYVDFSASRVVPTAPVNRERTFNAILCIICGKLRQVSGYRTLHLVDDQGVPTGNQVTLAVAQGSTEPVGFNPLLMATSEPPVTRSADVVPVWRNNTWSFEEDHRGKVAYFVRPVSVPYYPGGPAVDRAVADRIVVSRVGPLPEYLTLQEPPAEYPQWNGATWVVDEAARRRAQEERSNKKIQMRKELAALIKEVLDEHLANVTKERGVA